MANIQDLRAKHNPQFSYMFEVDVTGNNFSNNDITAMAKTVTIPQSSVEQMVINHKSGKTHYASRDAAAHTVSLTFWDDEDGTVHKFFNDWLETIQNPETMAGTTRDKYIADVNIRLKNGEDNATTAKISLSGCWVMEVSDITLSYDNNEAMEVSVTMSFETKSVEYSN